MEEPAPRLVPVGSRPAPPATRWGRGRVGVAILAAWLPLTLLTAGLVGGRPVVFSAIWLAAVLSQAPLGRRRHDWLARLGLLVYGVAFALPAVVPVDGGEKFSERVLVGYEVFSLPVGDAAASIGRIDSVASLATTIAGWLANLVFLGALALYRLREATFALVLAVPAASMAAAMLTVLSPGPGHLLWMGGLALFAAAAFWARADWA